MPLLTHTDLKALLQSCDIAESEFRMLRDDLLKIPEGEVARDLGQLRTKLFVKFYQLAAESNPDIITLLEQLIPAQNLPKVVPVTRSPDGVSFQATFTPFLSDYDRAVLARITEPGEPGNEALKELVKGLEDPHSSFQQNKDAVESALNEAIKQAASGSFSVQKDIKGPVDNLTKALENPDIGYSPEAQREDEAAEIFTNKPVSIDTSDLMILDHNPDDATSKALEKAIVELHDQAVVAVANTLTNDPPVA